MQLIKIGAVWCSGCLVMNKVWSKFIKEYKIDYLEYDIDFDSDEVSKYNPGDKLPLFIIFNGDTEVSRFSGEYSYDEFVDKMKGAGLIEKD